ncbi:type I restriction enzyme HsdR N-terminal domain-containing protein [Burkholderia cepacia]|uniref:type I restriction enzyme HsdR N-terminal domain-containing protein n=1 Tax=Burkholderia cepacia TaxID=292 RepID=UPI001589EFEC|nr:type I restriction enzyme HsdR N-terminal domain-containing protein [Burkholderia cepacia]
MSTVPKISELLTESDVEQKLLFPIITESLPYGLGIPRSHVLTKFSIRRLEIGKGREGKLYFPDYIVMSDGLPVLVIEAKVPGESVEEGFREARLYAHEINAKFQAGFNPVTHVICSNGKELLYGTPDSNDGVLLLLDELNVGSQKYAKLQEEINWTKLSSNAANLNQKKKPNRYWKPKKLLGGNAVQSEEVGRNSFGLTLSSEFGHIFAPETAEDKAEVARSAYVDSRASLRALDPIDKIIRAARPTSETNARLIEDTANPRELLSKLRGGSSLERKILLLIGSVGSGKSTFVDHLIYKALPQDVLDTTLWCRVDMNSAPISGGEIYKWLRGKISKGCVEKYPGEDFESFEVLKKVYSVEFNKFQKLQGKLLQEIGDQAEYNRSLLRHFESWQADEEVTSKAITRYCCGDRGKLLVIVLDNCDKRSRDEQLLMFQAAQWIQSEYRSLIILPLREETFEAHQDQPPLDTAIKDLIFRIEAPLFQHVLIRRVQLALSKMKADGEKTLRYDLPNGFRVEYPSTDLAFYLASIIKSLFEYDRFVRRMITGLSGKNIRRALEIFIDFCNSAHLGEDEIFRITSSEGRYTLPLYLVTRILLRGNLRYYDGQNSAVKNLFDIFHHDSAPFYFARLLILKWLSLRFNQPGRNGVRGYFPVSEMRDDLIAIGVPDHAFDRELDSLIKAHCVISENMTIEKVGQEDLVRLSSAGSVHLDLLGSVDYLATVAEDTWFDSKVVAEAIAERIGRMEKHFQVQTQIQNARDLVDYLSVKHKNLIEQISSFREFDAAMIDLVDISASEKGIESLTRHTITDPWFDLNRRLPIGVVVNGRITNRTKDHGLFVEIEAGVTGLLHKQRLHSEYMDDTALVPNEILRVEIRRIDMENKKLTLGLPDAVTQMLQETAEK